MKFLKKDEVYFLNILDYKGEKILLIEPQGPKELFLEKTIERNDGEYIDKDAKVYCKQRWLVDVLGELPFGKTFTTHRTLIFYHCKYNELIEEQGKIYKAREVFIRMYDSNPLNDNFISF